MIKKLVSRFVPETIRSARRVRQEPKDLRKVPTIPCEATALLPYEAVNTDELFAVDALAEDWADDKAKILEQGFTSGVGGVNEGDRRAIYYLIRHFKPKRVLEVGTHIGASTVHITTALRRNHESEQQEIPQLTTVDISDVNDEVAQPWLQYGAKQSPRSSVAKMGLASYVQFVTDSSLEYLAEAPHTFDFIFLDGDHAAPTVYQEVPLALRALSADGVILLHDYYPDAQPLWSNNVIHPGPFMACQRLQEEGARLKVLPLGRLPWSTKLGTNTTSLALLLRDGER